MYLAKISKPALIDVPISLDRPQMVGLLLSDRLHWDQCQAQDALVPWATSLLHAVGGQNQLET